MTDERGWGRVACDALDPAGTPCALEAGHEGNHLVGVDVPRPLSWYAAQALAVLVLIVLVGFILPLPITGIERLIVVVGVVAASIAWILRR